MVDGGGLENRWVNSPRGSNPLLSDFFFTNAFSRRGAREAEGGCLLSNCTDYGAGGSNPPFSEWIIMKPVKLNKESLLELKSRAVEYFRHAEDYIRNFDPLKLTYFPFIGWFIPMSIKKDDEFYMFHGKQAFVLAAYVIAACFLLYFLAHIFLPSWMDILRFILVLLIYVHYIVYIALCVMGTLMIKKGEKREFPYIGRYTSKLTAMINF